AAAIDEAVRNCVAVGADPATIYAATAPLPRNVDELLLAGFIRGRYVSMTRCVTNDLEVPAEAEFVLEGYVDPDEFRKEGPFGDHTGYYSLPDDYPVFHVTALTHRRNPLYCATVVGPPPMEDAYLGLATERLFLPLIQMLLPQVKDHWLPFEGVFHNLVVVAVEKSYPGEARQAIYGLWGQGQMSLAKAVLVVDADTPLRDPLHLAALILERLDPETDLIRGKGPLDVLDHASPVPVFGGKVGIDLTSRAQGEPPRQPGCEGVDRSSEALLKALNAIKEQVPGVVDARAWDGGQGAMKNGLAFASVEWGPGRNTSYYEELLFGLEAARAFNILVLFDSGVDLFDHRGLVWRACSNVDAERDIRVSGRRILVDACTKGPWDGHFREWPEELSFNRPDMS
ncbi:MAG: UbiD family decarboxylase, partial [Desulfobacteraceae bacterium]